MSEIRSQATPARDKARGELGVVIHNHVCVSNLEDCVGECYVAAAALQTAGWSKPRTVNSAAELDALPAGTVLRNNKSGRVFEKTRDKGAGKSKWMRMQDRWVYETYEILNESTWTVLFTPGGE